MLCLLVALPTIHDRDAPSGPVPTDETAQVLGYEMQWNHRRVTNDGGRGTHRLAAAVDCCGCPAHPSDDPVRAKLDVETTSGCIPAGTPTEQLGDGTDGDHGYAVADERLGLLDINGLGHAIYCHAGTANLETDDGRALFPKLRSHQIISSVLVLRQCLREQDCLGIDCPSPT